MDREGLVEEGQKGHDPRQCDSRDTPGAPRTQGSSTESRAALGVR